MDEKWSKLASDVATDELLAKRLREEPLLVLKQYGLPLAAERELSDSELSEVAGGMKWDQNHQSCDVIDARGGQFKVFGVSFTLDAGGNVSSVNGKSPNPC